MIGKNSKVLVGICGRQFQFTKEEWDELNNIIIERERDEIENLIEIFDKNFLPYLSI